MQVKEHGFNAEVALSHPAVQNAVQQLREVLEQLPVLSYPGKSLTQKRIHVLQSLANEYLELWMGPLLGWKSQVSVARPSKVTRGTKTGWTIDFCRELDIDGVTSVIAMEIQFGNSGRVEKDLAKFEALRAQKQLVLAIVVQLCDETARLTDSGLATYESSLARLSPDNVTLPLLMIGLSHRNTPVIDLRECREVTDPRFLGGKGGPGSKKIKAFVAEQLASGVAPRDIRLPEALKKLIRVQTAKWQLQEPPSFRTFAWAQGADCGVYGLGQMPPSAVSCPLVLLQGAGLSASWCNASGKPIEVRGVWANSRSASPAGTPLLRI